ncbi:glutaminase domain-containing protein, partial [Bacteroides nordii]
FGSADMPNVKTGWNQGDIWIRRRFSIDNKNVTKKKLYLVYSHDDIFELYLNGQMLVSTGYSWKNYVIQPLDAEQVKSLMPEDNLIAAHCHNTKGGAYVDFGLFTEDEIGSFFSMEAEQIKVNVLPTQTYYSFYCGPVQLNLKFTSPLVLNDLDLLSSPVNYISYEVQSLDKHTHDVQIYFSVTPQWAVNSLEQEVSVESYQSSGIRILKTGTLEQNVLGKSGDIICIDWGYFYLAGKQSEFSEISMGAPDFIQGSFVEKGILPDIKTTRTSVRLDREEILLAYSENLGSVKNQKAEGYLMIGYDDIASIQYFGKNLKAYWKKKYPMMEAALADARKNYAKTIQKCDAWDRKVMEDAVEAGGQQYAELCAVSYRQAVAAHKLVSGPDDELFFFSKENNSNGSIGTVDVTYPSCPVFIRYNTEIMKAMLNFIFDYSESGRWTKPFAAHDIGTYPLANGQTYQEDMPVEETGNMLIMTTAIAIADGNADYAAKHWETLTIWSNYLAEEGLDPENQLCTEDFAGHLAHNANLSAKAIMAIAGYGRLAEMLNKPEAKKYTEMAKKMAVEWEQKANDGDHYRLSFDKPDTWSQKYNFVWDKTLGLNILPDEIMKKEVAFYLKNQNKYGLPLDYRFTWGKTDDTVWSATMADSESDFQELIRPLWKYVNETSSRVPLGDWYETLNADYINFRARSVVGGVFMKSLDCYLRNTRK